MRLLLDWLDDRTGMRELVHDALYERIPGGARWRYVWGSTLSFAFVTQLITGIFLWMSYSPSSRTAWESVYYIQHEMQFGWLLRGIHHYMAQMMIVLMIFHLLQVVIDGAYKAPREINFWMGLVLMMLVMGLGLTGYLLPWDQKGYWASAVATNLMGFVPYIGDSVQKVVVGGNEYGHQTLTRFFALHAGVLPGALMFFLAIHIALFRKHGIKTPESDKPTAYFWPDQVLKDAVACLAVLAVVLLLCTKGFFTPHEGLAPGDYMGAHLASPADPSEQYAAARPEWYFLFLFEGLKYFTPETMGSELLGNEFVGAIVAPGVMMGFLFLMPLLGNWKLGHGFNVAMLFALILGAGLLTARALQTDYYARIYTSSETSDDPVHEKRIRDSQTFLAAKQQADFDAHRIREVIKHRGGIPYAGAIELMRTDAEIQGPKLFTKFCASCHPYLDANGEGIAGPQPPTTADGEEPEPWGGANLYGFATRQFVTDVLDPEKFASNDFFGATAHKEDEMATYLNDNVSILNEEGQAQLQLIAVALSAEAELVSQRDADAKAAEDGTLEAGREALLAYLPTTEGEADSACTDCHKFRDEGDLGSTPDLTGYGNEEWLIGIIADPEHERFYEGNNDRMPAFGGNEDEPEKNPLTLQQIRMIARWMRGDDRDLSADDGTEQ